MISFRQFRSGSPLPAEDGAALWLLQLELMEYAEGLFGARNRSKILYCPDFDEDGPFVRHTPNFDGAFADLSLGSRIYWPCALYELAHETIHLLDPRGSTETGVPKANYLEEAAATLFALHCTDVAGLDKPVLNGNYAVAVDAMEKTGADPFSLASTLRAKHGHLSAITSEDILTEAPSCPADVAALLADPFPGR